MSGLTKFVLFTKDAWHILGRPIAPDSTLLILVSNQLQDRLLLISSPLVSALIKQDIFI